MEATMVYRDETTILCWGYIGLESLHPRRTCAVLYAVPPTPPRPFTALVPAFCTAVFGTKTQDFQNICSKCMYMCIYYIPPYMHACKHACIHAYTLIRLSSGGLDFMNYSRAAPATLTEVIVFLVHEGQWESASQK